MFICAHIVCKLRFNSLQTPILWHMKDIALFSFWVQNGLILIFGMDAFKKMWRL